MKKLARMFRKCADWADPKVQPDPLVVTLTLDTSQFEASIDVIEARMDSVRAKVSEPGFLADLERVTRPGVNGGVKVPYRTKPKDLKNVTRGGRIKPA